MNKLGKFIIIAVAVTAVIAGCRMVDEPVAIDNLPSVRIRTIDEPVLVADQTDEAIERRFTDPDQEQTSAVDSALMWSEKYDQQVKKNESLTEKNTKLFMENSDLRKKLQDVEAKLAKTQTQLDEANTFMREMHLELTKWKSDVLGFRDEMRQAQAVQLQALSKVLKILGAEPMADQTAMNLTDSDNLKVTK